MSQRIQAFILLLVMTVLTGVQLYWNWTKYVIRLIKFPAVCHGLLILFFSLCSRIEPSLPVHEQALMWVDPKTGHRIVQLSREPGSENLYFNTNSFTPDGKKMIITTPSGIDMIDLKTFAIDKVVEGKVYVIMVGRKTGRIYYVTPDRCVFSIDPVTKLRHKIVTLPYDEEVSTVNADETLLGGISIEAPPGSKAKAYFFDDGPNQLTNIKNARIYRYKKDRRMRKYLTNHYRMGLFSYNIQTGETKKIYSYNGWLNHLQFSPTDLNLLLFCHEGFWQDVDRIWTIRTDGTGLTLIHKRSMPMEIAGHEFWGADGKTIWYDLQTPKDKVYWIAGYNIVTGQRIRYHLHPFEVSVHYNVSADGRLFSGDGEDIYKGNKWIYLFHPRGKAIYGERLVNLANHDYSTEPNTTFTPDMKWIIFRSNMSGTNQVYAVELKKSSF